MRLFSDQTYINRRKRLAEQIQSGIILIIGNRMVPRNYAANYYPFRQDSNFLYFFGLDIPGLIGLIDVDSGESFLFGYQPTIDDLIWEGPIETLDALGQKVGVERTFPLSRLESFIDKSIQLKRTIHFLPPYRTDRIVQLSELLSIPHEQVRSLASQELIHAVIQLRSVKNADEINEIEFALNQITSGIILKAIEMSKPGVKEYEIAAIAECIAKQYNCQLAYPPICTINGQYLHNESYSNTLESGKLLLLDVGSESQMHYASDITRTFPVDKQFTTQQAYIYNLVLAMMQTAFQHMKPGIPYMYVHYEACKTLTQGLIDLGLMKGDVNEIVEKGAHALFFPHGLGHLLGLDVHDMEDLGENNTGYDETITRSNQFGTKFLRYGKALQNGTVITVEPGIYFIPALIEQWKKEKAFETYICYDKLNDYLNFGGIRIEDNVLVTDGGVKILGNPIPKSIHEIELLKAEL